MQNTGLSPLTGPTKPKYNSGVNPFARALAETEKQGFAQQPNSSSGTDIFRDALARTGGQFGDFPDPNQYSGDPSASGGMPDENAVFDQSQWEQQQAEQQAQLEAQRKKDLLRNQLHRQVNQIETDVYSAREKKVKEEIDKLRQELQLLVKDVAKFHKEVEVTLMTEVVQPGQDGKYYISFFQQLRSFIMLLRQKIKSASTWATQIHSKKKKRKGAPGMMISGQGYEKTSTVQDMMHHERNSAYSGG